MPASFGKLWLCLFACGSSCFPQSPASVRYFYDDANELFRVLDSTGTLIEYIYDPAGNITQINRSIIAPGSPAILNITPLSGVAGNTLIIYGQNFAPVSANDVVKINGATATVLFASATQLTIQVPGGATAGQVTVTVNGVTASSGPTLVYMPLPAPLITSLTPDGAIAGTVVPVAVAGTNLGGAIFNFPAGATAMANNVTPTSANLQVASMAGIRGAFPLIATTSAGSSTSSITAGNHFIVMLSPDEADGQVISVLNTADPISQSADRTSVANSVNSQVVSVLNTVDPTTQSTDPTNVANEADSAVVSLLNAGSSPMNVPPTLSGRKSIREFASPFADTGTIQVKPSGPMARLVAGQTLAIGVRAQSEAAEVELFVNGSLLGRSRQRPWVFTFNVPIGVPSLAFTVADRDANGTQLASYEWQSSVIPDAGSALTGRVVDEAGNPVPGARVKVEAAGWYGEFFELHTVPTSMPDLAKARRTRAGLVSGLDWLNPQGTFGDDPMGIVATPFWAARFTGRFFAPQSGNYQFPINAQAWASLLIDGKPASGSIDLTAGTHAIEVSYYKASGAAALEILWVEPNGAGMPLPLESVSASDPALTVVAGDSGAFSIAGVPAKVGEVRVVVQLPDRSSGASAWQAPVNGAVTGLGDMVVERVQR